MPWTAQMAAEASRGSMQVRCSLYPTCQQGADDKKRE
jgi:hypothetical protein